MDFSLLLSELGPAGKQEGKSRQQRLYSLLKRAILDGILVANTRLPSTRQLADDYEIARNSVTWAYDQLRFEGFLVSDHGGTRVKPLPIAAQEPCTVGNTDGAHARLSVRSELVQHIRRPSEFLPFMPGVPDLHAFPWRLWSRALQQAWNDIGARHLAYAPPGGEISLRRAIANRLRVDRGLVCDADQVLVTAGAQMALDVCARMLADFNDIAWMEDPGYYQARSVMESAGLKVEAVPVDSDGMVVDDERWTRSPPRMIFLTPSHQYPMGSVLSLPRRLEFLKRATQYGTWLIEDDYDSEFHYGATQITALQGIAPDASVVYIGTFSKSLFPGLRIGYMVVPKWACARIAEGLHEYFRPGQAVEQLVLARFIESGDLARHIRRMRVRYFRRQGIFREQLQKYFGADASIHGGSAGMHLTVVFHDEINDIALSRKAAELGITVPPLSAYVNSRRQEHTPCGMVLGYGVVKDETIERLVPRLRWAFDEVANRCVDQLNPHL